MFPRLPLLALIEARSRFVDFGHTSLTAVQHLLRETGCLFETVQRLGVPPHSTFAIGKPYSSNPEVARQMQCLGIQANIPCGGWTTGSYGAFFQNAIGKLLREERAIGRLHTHDLEIVLDDGGYCLDLMLRGLRMPRDVVGIEQTTSGLKLIAERALTFPIIAVATSCAKRCIEPPIVLRAAEAKLSKRLADFRKLRRIGVIGLGNIGY